MKTSWLKPQGPRVSPVSVGTDNAPMDRPSCAAYLIPAVLLSWVTGVALQLQQTALWSPAIYLCFLGYFLLVSIVLQCLSAIKKIASWRRVVLVCSAVVACSFALTGLRASLFLAQALDPALQGRDLRVNGVIAAMPSRSADALRFRLDVQSAAALDGTKVNLPARIELSWYRGWERREVSVDSEEDPLLALMRQPQHIVAGDHWQFTVRLKSPHGNSNPHGFDYELWLWEQGVQATGYVRAGRQDEPAQLLEHTWRHPVERTRQSVREAIFARVTDPQLAGIIAALVVGDQNAIERSDWNVFRATGVAHLMSISGLHITMFAWLASLLLTWAWKSSARLTPTLCLAWPACRVGAWGGLALALAYGVFSGWGIPTQRTLCMLAVVVLLNQSARRWPWWCVWLLAMAVVLAIDPWAWLQAGFWLSFVAVGVLFATDHQADEEQALPAPVAKRSHKWMQAAYRLLREQWVVTLALTPLSLLLFGQVSLVGLLANLAAIPWVTLVVTPLAMLGVLHPAFWSWAAQAIEWLIVFLQTLAHLPWATLSVATAPVWFATLGVLGGLLLTRKGPWRWRIAGLPLLLPVLLWQAPRPAMGHFELLAADIGQGNAVLVRTAKHSLVYDTGPRFSRESDAGERVLVPLLRAWDEHVDTVVVSHRDSDHSGGAAAVLAMQPQATLLSSIEETHELQRVRPAQRCYAGQHWLWDGVYFEVLHPQPAYYAVPHKPNALSCVLRISNGTQIALLVGDIEQAQEQQLVQTMPAQLRANVLLVPHHGSKTSSSPEFLDAVQPHFAWVQAGYRNRFGHPAASVMQRYKARNISVFNSAHCGAIAWSSQHPERSSCQREQARRYWQADK